MAKFVSGNPGGPGRPKGARSKLEESFLEAVYNDWKDNGVAVIAKVRTEDPSTYLRVVSAILPKESKVDVAVRKGESLTEEHARLVAEGFLDSLRSGPGDSAQEPDRLHDAIPSGLPSSRTTP